MNITEVKRGDTVHMAKRAFGQRLVYGTESKYAIKGGEKAEVLYFGDKTNIELRVEGHGVVNASIWDITE